jgi:pyridoxine kinase
MGVQVCSFPTAVLSTHTGGFEGYSFVDLTDHMEEYMNHWYRVGIDFDCIYSGFLGSARQIEIISRFIDKFSANSPLVVIDPVMGDDGELYETMGQDMVDQMKGFIKKATIITPNFTEAAYLLDEEYREDITETELKNWLVRLSDMGPDNVVITSAPDSNEKKNSSVAAYNRKEGGFWKISSDYIPVNFPGTGDAFTSVIVGSLLQGDTLPDALRRGVRFITTAIKASSAYEYPHREGILLEKVLGSLNDKI